MTDIIDVAVIGAGAAGLAVAKRLCEFKSSQGGFRNVVVYERNAAIGGTWIYDEAHGPDLNAVNPAKIKPATDSRSAIYTNLHTNLTTEFMAFQDFPFPPDTPTFPDHRTVLSYLESYAEKHSLMDVIQLYTDVRRVVKDPGGRKWMVTVARESSEVTIPFDAVVVCSGHYYLPNVPEIAGFHDFPGRIFHSKDYRIPDNMVEKNVVVVGGGPSGIDIAREVCKYAQNTVISLKDPNAIGDIGESVESLDLTAVVAIATSGQTTQTLLPSSSKRISKKPEITKLHKDGSVEFADGSVVPDVDVIILCTGYLYSFPFLPDLSSTSEERLLTSTGLGVHNLSKGIFYIPDPTLSFVGLHYKIDPFPLFDLQARLIANAYRFLAISDRGVLSVKNSIDTPLSAQPSGGASSIDAQMVSFLELLCNQEKMRGEEKREESEFGVNDGDRKKLILGNRQYDYWDFIANLLGVPKVEPSRLEKRQYLFQLRKKFLGY